MIELKESFKVDQLTVKIAANREEMGADAAEDVLEEIKRLLLFKKEVNMIFAAAPSQNEFLAALAKDSGIEWSRVNAFHMDEYLGLDSAHPMRFGNFLKKRIFDKIPFGKVFYLNKDGNLPAIEIKKYTSLLKQYPADIVCMGIGENTHIAFNDPHVANFNDASLIKKVKLDKISRQQQVNDGCFPNLAQVPTSALTLTIPALINAQYIFCIVPGKNKANAIYHTLKDDINEKYPSSSLRKHQNAILYLDEDSAKEIKREYI